MSILTYVHLCTHIHTHTCACGTLSGVRCPLLSQDDVEIEPSPDVEAMLALLESGQPLPPDPREAGIERESAAAFTARLDKIVARYESQFLKRHEWQVRLPHTPGS